jgi:hypothetical protein
MMSYLLNSLLQRSPLVVVILAGILFSIVRWRRHPRVSLITLIALVFYLIKIFVFAALNYWLPTLRVSMHLSYAAINNLYTVLNVFSNLVFGVVVIVLVAAAFTGRRSEAAANPGSTVLS